MKRRGRKWMHLGIAVFVTLFSISLGGYLWDRADYPLPSSLPSPPTIDPFAPAHPTNPIEEFRNFVVLQTWQLRERKQQRQEERKRREFLKSELARFPLYNNFYYGQEDDSNSDGSFWESYFELDATGQVHNLTTEYDSGSPSGAHCLEAVRSISRSGSLSLKFTFESGRKEVWDVIDVHPEKYRLSSFPGTSEALDALSVYYPHMTLSHEKSNRRINLNIDAHKDPEFQILLEKAKQWIKENEKVSGEK